MLGEPLPPVYDVYKYKFRRFKRKVVRKFRRFDPTRPGNLPIFVLAFVLLSGFSFYLVSVFSAPDATLQSKDPVYSDNVVWKKRDDTDDIIGEAHDADVIAVDPVASRKKRQEDVVRRSKEHLKEHHSRLPTAADMQYAVREAFKHAWGGYEKHAMGHDEIRPTTNATNDSWGGFGATLIDALDTMLVMGLGDEFDRAVRHLEANLDFDKDYDCSFFETSIRMLGGLLGAYELSGERFLLEQATDLATRLLPSFDTPTGLPRSVVNLRTGKAHNHQWAGGSILAEVGSIQLEFKYLSKATGDPKFAKAADKVMEALSKAKTKQGLYYVYYEPETLSPSSRSHISFGALGDSFYEYLLKQWVQSEGSDERVKKMYDDAMAGMFELLAHESSPNGMPFLSEYQHDRPDNYMDHLVCFVPGMLMLGAAPENTDDSELAKKHKEFAMGLAETCASLAHDSPTGLSPEAVEFHNSPSRKRSAPDYTVKKTFYLLRPETIESMFYMWRYTKDPKWRSHGWKIFLAIEKHCKTDSSYTGLVDVTKNPPEPNNSMQSFFLAETLKYLFLLFSDDDDLLPLDKYVFNTEAHPLGIVPRTLA